MRSIHFFPIFALLILSACGKTVIPTQMGLTPAPSPQESVESIGSTMENNPTFRSCVANASKSCGLEVVASIARSAKDASGCDVFDNLEIKNACVDAVKFEIAKQSGDLSSCSVFEASERITACQVRLLNFVAQKSKLPTACKDGFSTLTSKLPDNIDPIGPCEYQQVVSGDGNTLSESFCKNLSSNLAKDECFKRLKNQTLPPPPLPPS